MFLKNFYTLNSDWFFEGFVQLDLENIWWQIPQFLIRY